MTPEQKQQLTDLIVEGLSSMMGDEQPLSAAEVKQKEPEHYQKFHELISVSVDKVLTVS